MVERTGTVTEFVTNPKENNKVFGLKLDSALKEDEYIYSFPDYRGEPFQDDKVKRGDRVRLEYADVERDGKTKHYISVLEIIASVTPEAAQALSDEAGDHYRTRTDFRRTSALAQSVAFHAQAADPSADAVIKTASIFEKYLEGGYEYKG